MAPNKVDVDGYNIYLNENEESIFRPYSDKISYSDEKFGRCRELKEIRIDSVDDRAAAVGWLLHHDYQGAIPSGLGVKGLRARVGNIQVGDDRIFSSVFPKERFCSWTVGEVHITDNRIAPNGRRDNFERNNHRANLILHLTPCGTEVGRHCRVSSQIRNRLKEFELGEQKVLQKLDIAEQGAVSKSALGQLKRDLGTHLSDLDRLADFDMLEDQDQTDLKKRHRALERKINRKRASNPMPWRT